MQTTRAGPHAGARGERGAVALTGGDELREVLCRELEDVLRLVADDLLRVRLQDIAEVRGDDDLLSAVDRVAVEWHGWLGGFGGYGGTTVATVVFAASDLVQTTMDLILDLLNHDFNEPESCGRQVGCVQCISGWVLTITGTLH